VSGPGNNLYLSLLCGEKTSKRHNDEKLILREGHNQKMLYKLNEFIPQMTLRLSGGILHSKDGIGIHN